MRNARVLIVDDDPALLEALSEALQLRAPGLVAETADAAAAALQRVSSDNYDAIVADIKMPGMDGLELLSRVRELRPDVPTLLITGHGEQDLAVQALRGGAHDYIPKPIDRDYFVRSLLHAIERHRLSQKVARQKHALEQQTKKLESWLEDRTHELRDLYQREALARAQLEKISAELEAAQRRRDELISMIAHDLGTPLTTLRGYAELLTRPNVSPAIRDRARAVILSETSRMARLIQDLVSDSETPRAGFSIQLGRCDLVELVREQIEVAATRSTQHTLILDAPGRLSMRCDRERVAQVLTNLLGNAMTYTPPGEIRVRLWGEGRDAHVSVRDSGPGIPAEKLNTIFEPGVRLQGHARHGATGAGLGLSIARDIVEAHGGRIWADSRPGDGTTFSIVLPTCLEEHQPVSTRSKAPRTSPQQRAGSRTPVG